MPHPPNDGARGTDESLEDVSVEQNPTQDVVTFFGLAAAPFLVGPTFENASSVGPLGERFKTLQQALRDGTAVSIVTGPTGAGKTSLCERIAHSAGLSLRTVLLGSGRFDEPSAILQAVLFELEEPFEGLALQELRLRLLRVARQLRSTHDGLLVIVDDAEQLPTDVLDELRSWTSHSDEGQPAIRLLLSGNIDFDERLASPELQGLNQRIGCHVTQDSLTFDESAQFLAERLESAGGTPEAILQEDAFELICRASDGSLRGLCALAAHSLRNAASGAEQPVSVETVVETLHGLRHLPVHWNLPAQYAFRVDEAASPEMEGDAATDPAADEVVLDVPDWSDGDDEVAVLEFGPDDNTPATVSPNEHSRQADEQKPMDSVSTPEVVEFSIDDPYAALDQQHGICSEIVPLRPDVPGPAAAGDAPLQAESLPAMDTTPSAEAESAVSPVEGIDESDCESGSDSDCDVETETKIRGELETLSRQIHEALRNTGRLRERSDLCATDWQLDDIEYDVIEPDDGSGNGFDLEEEVGPVQSESSIEPECEPVQERPDPSESPEHRVVPIADSEQSLPHTTADIDSFQTGEPAEPDERPTEEPVETGGVNHYLDEAERPRSRYALLFSRLKRRRADVARRIADGNDV